MTRPPTVKAVLLEGDIPAKTLPSTSGGNLETFNSFEFDDSPLVLFDLLPQELYGIHVDLVDHSMFSGRVRSRTGLGVNRLVSNPHLEKLEIYPVPNSNSDGDGFRSVPLQHLEELRLDGDTGQVFGLLSRLEHPEEMTTVTLNISHCVIAEVLQTIGPYMGDHLRRRGRSQNGLGLCLSSSGFIAFKLDDGVGLYPSASVFPRMTSFPSLDIGFDRQALPDILEKLTLVLLSHTPRDEIL